MFTGLVQVVGKIAKRDEETGALLFQLPAERTDFLTSTKVGDSIAVNGVCLTATSVQPDSFTAVLGEETLARTTFSQLALGDEVNLEPCLTVDTPLGGHLVSGHVDGVLQILEIADAAKAGDKMYRFSLPEEFARFVVAKGSVCLNGVSLTVVSATDTDFTVMLIPHTLNHTNLGKLALGAAVNFEIDLIARYAVTGEGLSKQSLKNQALLQAEPAAPTHSGNAAAFSHPEVLIEEIKQGRMVIMLDDEDRENEGDLIMSADAITAWHINFMARYGRGLVCMPMTEAHGKQLNLPLMAPQQAGRKTTNFTISIEAATGVSTGISTADRAHTIAVAAKANAKASDVVSPGHIFPLLAKPGGVLERRGHTEATVDLVTMAGCGNCGVIVEILNEDGTMARRDDCVAFAKHHGLKVGTVADLAAYRLEQEATSHQDVRKTC